MVAIWHNPKCATSRKVLDMIRAHGIEPTIVDYQKTPPSKAEIRAVLKEMGMTPRDLLRRRGTRPLNDAKWTDAQLIAAMHEHPRLIERPVVRTRKGTRLCRPPEQVKDIL
jgi:arsenate reductase